jgi:hypothetical protein
VASFLGLLRAQEELQHDSFGYDFEEMTDEERITYIRDNLLACTDELHEALRETGWKPWATSRHINHDRYVKELVDAFHFFMNLLLALRIPGLAVEDIAEEFTRRYFAKRDVNAERQRTGYDGRYDVLPQELESSRGAHAYAEPA